MDSFEEAFYEMSMKMAFYEKKANEFQAFFSEIMTLKYPYKFIKTKPWGQLGDEKCDGYNLETGEFFQVYAPDEMTAKDAESKINDDFLGAYEKWGDKIKKWYFVSNAKNGVGPHIVQTLTALSMDYPEIEFCHMGQKELNNMLFQLDESDIRSILGPAPTFSSINDISTCNISKVISGIKKKHETQNDKPIKPVSSKKLTTNGLSENTKHLLQVGMIKDNLVSEYFAKWYEHDLEENTAKEINSIYERLKGEGKYDPDEIFGHIYKSITPNENPDSMACTLAIMAYFFEKCIIFEDAEEEVS